MKKLLEKQQNFVDNKAAGLNGAQAAIAAGYSAAGAKVTAAKLMKLPHIKSALAAVKRKAGNSNTQVKIALGVDGDEEQDESPLRTNYPTGLALLQHAYNNPRLPTGLRIDCAKQALPYESGKIGEAGKKENQKKRAAELTGNTVGGRQKFSPVAPPKLVSVK